MVAVGGHGDVFDLKGAEVRDEIFHAGADGGFAASHAHFFDAERFEHAREAIELRPGQDFVMLAIIFRVGGAAVHATEIAAIGDRDAQVGDLPAEFVVKRHVCFKVTSLVKKQNPIR